MHITPKQELGLSAVCLALIQILCPQELKFLDGVIQKPVRPLVAIVGGSKVSSKITVLEALVQKVDKLILG